MNPKDYLEASARTASGKFHADRVGWRNIKGFLREFQAYAEYADEIKKALFYGKGSVGHPPSGDASEFAGMADELHAVLGMVTETAELMNVLFDDEAGSVLDEAGDLLWYTALLLRKRGLTFEQAMEANIKKLLVRYPDKFSADLAVNRNDAAEQKVFASSH